MLADNGQQFTTPGNEASAASLIREAMDRGEIFRAHGFELACAEHRIEHRLTKPHHPWTNGQVERMNRTLKDATVRRYHCSSHDELRGHLALFLDAYNFARRLKTLKGLTPDEASCRCWATEAHRFIANPHHEMPGPNIQAHPLASPTASLLGPLAGATVATGFIGSRGAMQSPAVAGEALSVGHCAWWDARGAPNRRCSSSRMTQ